ncbi:MAG: hypothetical protein WKG07_06730 [Hymenobacter sp.]
MPELFNAAEIAALLRCIEEAPVSGPNFRRSQEVFAIRNLLGEVPRAVAPAGYRAVALAAVLVFPGEVATSPRPSILTSPRCPTGWCRGIRI